MTRDGKSFVSLSPLAIIDKAIKEVPAVKYALGVAGVSAAVAIITFLIGKSTTSIFMLGAVFIGMILLFLFSTLINSPSASNQIAGYFLIWAVLLFFITFLIFTITAIAKGWPCNWAELLNTKSACQVRESIAYDDCQGTTAPEVPSTRISSFTIFPKTGVGSTNKRIWKRAVHDRWVETYVADNIEAVFRVKCRTTLSNGCPGTVLSNEHDPSFRAFIPDKGCPGMPFLIRSGSNGWSIVGPMKNWE